MENNEEKSAGQGKTEEEGATADSQAPSAKNINVGFGSNEVRLTGRQWVVAGVLTCAICWLIPVFWRQAESFETGPDYRISYELSEDYWLFDRFCRQAVADGKTLVLGDSVVWSPFVQREHSLTHYLNRHSGGDRFVNLGVDGMHPLALEGLVRRFGRAISGKDVIVHCNPLWMSSPERDLRKTDQEAARFNHPKLVSQFFPGIPGYDEGISPRIGIVAERNLEILSWTTHLRLAYFNRSDLPSWTLEQPYDSIFGAIDMKVPEHGDRLRHKPVSWIESRIPKQNWPWVDLDTSPQWRAFRGILEELQKRNNRVFVVVGPINEHMLEEGSRTKYIKLRGEIADYLEESQIPHCLPELLPSEMYADASHPLSQGYDLLAQHILDAAAFRIFGKGKS